MADEEKGNGEKKRNRSETFRNSQDHQLLIAKLKATMVPTVRQAKCSSFEMDILGWDKVVEWSAALKQNLPASPFVSADPATIRALKKKVLLWAVVYSNYDECSHILSKDDCSRRIGKQICILLLDQNTEKGKEQKLKISLHAERLYEYETSDSFGVDVISSSVKFVDRYILKAEYQLLFTKGVWGTKLQ